MFLEGQLHEGGGQKQERHERYVVFGGLEEQMGRGQAAPQDRSVLLQVARLEDDLLQFDQELHRRRHLTRPIQTQLQIQRFHATESV